MAIFPQGLSNIDQRCNTGERRVLHQLKRCLNDDHLVWHNVPLGPRARQPDFVVLSPRQGVLLLEVKDWKRGTLAAANRDTVELALPRGRVTEANPLRQARDYCMELVALMQTDPALTHGAGAFAGRLLFPYGWGVVFSHLRRSDVEGSDFADIFHPDRTLLRDDLDDSVEAGHFQARLWGMFTVHYPHTLTLPQRDRIRWHLFPEIRMPAQAALTLEDSPGHYGNTPLAPMLPDLLRVMDLQQEQIARTLGEGHRIIHGAAGSGKTMILIFRAHQLAAAARVDQPILVLCFNRPLAERIDGLLRQRGVDERVQVRTFHGWCQDMVRSYQLAVDTPYHAKDYYQKMVAVVERALETGFVPAGQYTALLVDEAHDFEDAWLRIATRLVNPASNSLLVLYDDTQSIYQKQRRQFNFAQVGIQAQGRTSILRLNYRNTAEVLALSLHCARRLLQSQAELGLDDEASDVPRWVRPASAGRHGPLPVLVEARQREEEAQLLAERIVAAANRGHDWSDMLVLCRAKYLMAPMEQALRRQQVPFQSMNAAQFRRFDWERPSVKLMTMHSAKGLEFPLVFVAGLQALPMGGESQDDAVRLLYVAMTRATHELVLSASGRSVVVDQVRRSLAEVTRQASDPAGGTAG